MPRITLTHSLTAVALALGVTLAGQSNVSAQQGPNSHASGGFHPVGYEAPAGSQPPAPAHAEANEQGHSFHPVGSGPTSGSVAHPGSSGSYGFRSSADLPGASPAGGSGCGKPKGG